MPSLRTVAVLGGGHGALAAAGDLARRGFEVRLGLRNRPRFDELFRTRRLAMAGAGGEGVAELALVTDDHAHAVAGADLVVIPLPAFAQAAMAERIAGAIRPHHVVLLTPGNFGAYALAFRLPGALLAETATLPYGARQSGPASVRLALYAHHLPTGVHPAAATDLAMEAIVQAYPVSEPVEDALSAALLNSNASLHAPLVVLNAGPIERLSEYDIHVEGTTPGILRVIEALDGERILLRQALGYGPEHWPLMDYYADRDWFYGPGAFGSVQRRSVWREKIDFEHRYLSEDVDYGLVLWSSIGHALGVPTPLTDAFLDLVSTLTGRDRRTAGRSLESAGLGGLGAAAIRARL